MPTSVRIKSHTWRGDVVPVNQEVNHVWQLTYGSGERAVIHYVTDQKVFLTNYDTRESGVGWRRLKLHI